ncbi:MAG: substrate-binding domain-containing protein, partial [Arachnia sp.]
AAIEESGVQLTFADPEEMSILAGRAEGERMLAEADLPDAIFAMNDLLAVGLLQALVMRGGIDVPGDVALIGYDDIDFCANAVVPLSSVRQPSVEMGTRAVELLELALLEGAAHQHQHVQLRPELIVRASTVA